MKSSSLPPSAAFSLSNFPVYSFEPDPQTGWRFEQPQSLLEHEYLKVEDLQIHSPGRPEGLHWTVGRRRNAVVIAPQLADGRFLLIHQERYPIARTLWEFPAGMIDHHQGREERETILAFAHQELAEETGHELGAEGQLLPLGYYFSSPGFWDEHAYQFLAKNLQPLEGVEALGEGNETIHEVRPFSAAELQQMIAQNEIVDANSLSIWARLVAQGLVQV